MHPRPLVTFFTLVIVSIPSTVALHGQSVRDGYAHPTFTMPYAWNKPTLDGVVDEAEWRQALSITALQSVAGQVNTRQTTFRVCWDEEHIYVAMQSPVRPGERLVQALRRRIPEKNVVFDDSYEVFIDAGTTTEDGQPCFFQFLGNFAGARYDILHLPAVGNTRVNWSSHWEPMNRLTDNNVWEWEMAIPRKDLFLDRPFSEGQKISMLLARNYKRPWEQTSLDGAGTFGVPDTHSKYVLSKSAPAIHLRSVANVETRTLGVSLAAWSKEATSIAWSYTSDGGVSESGVLKLPAGELTADTPRLALEEPGDGAFRIRVTSADGKKSYVDWSAKRAFSTREVEPKLDDRSDVVCLQLNLNPVADYLRIDGDFIQYDERDKFKQFKVVVMNAQGETIASEMYEMDELSYVSGILPLPDLPAGDYKAQLECMDADGIVLLSLDQPFAKKNHAEAFVWWKTRHGNIEKAISPWTPVQASKSRVAVWGRELAVGAAGLPAQVTSQKHALLAGPVRLELDGEQGRTATAQPGQSKLVSSTDHRAELNAQATLSDLAITSRVTAEFDGMYRVEMRLSPKDKPVPVKGLRMVVPFDDGQVDYYHAAGRGIRYGFDYGYIPDGNGRLWDCRKVSGNPMQVGSFVPYVIVTGPEAGLCWYADSDEGWIPNDDVPAVELRRDTEGVVNLVFNFISSDIVIDNPRTITFAFQATPIKKMHKGWRMDGWWCGDTFRDFQILGKHGGHQIWTNTVFTLDEEACQKLVDAQHNTVNKYNFGVDVPAYAVPYLEWKTLSAKYAPEVAYFGDQWKTSISDGLAFEETLSDYIVYHMYNWAKTNGIDGIYIDNNRPQACARIEAGRGYRLPDGRVQPTYNLFALRKLYLRMRAAFQEANGRSKFVLHTTNNFIAPWLGAADVAYDGEHHVIYPRMNKDFMDFWKPDRMRLSYGGQWGTAVNFMSAYQGDWSPKDMARVYRSYTGACILYDALPSGNANGRNTPLWIGRQRFGIDADDVQYLGPWRTDSGVSSSQPDIYLAVWKRDGKILVAVVNYGEAVTAQVKIDGATLGLGNPSGWKVEDAEADTQIKQRDPKLKKNVVVWDSASEGVMTLQPDGTVSVPVRRHDYRQFILTRQ